MEVVRASCTWDDPATDVFTLYVEPTPDLWEADPVHSVDALVFIYRVLDENEQETEAIAGLEIIGFLDFDEWDGLPKLPMLWQLPEWEPLPLEELLRSMQKDLREQAATLKREQARAL